MSSEITIKVEASDLTRDEMPLTNAASSKASFPEQQVHIVCTPPHSARHSAACGALRLACDNEELPSRPRHATSRATDGY